MMNLIYKIKYFFKEKPELSDSNVHKLLIKLSIPAIIGIIITNLYNIIDSIFIGHGVGADAIGALTACAPFQLLLNTCITTIASGAISVLSINLGSENYEKAAYSFGNSIVLTFLLSIFLSVSGFIFTNPLLILLGAENNILEFASQYLHIILIGIPFLALSFMFSELVRAQGRAKEAMTILSLGAVLNIIGDYMFIMIFNFGIRGAAIATSLAYLLSFLYGLYIIKKKKNLFKVELHHFKLNFTIIKEMFSIGGSSLISQGANTIAITIANAVILNIGGNMMINSIGVFNKLRDIVYMPIFGIVQGMQPILGYNYGAKRLDKVEQASNLTLRYVFTIALISSLIIGGYAKSFVSLFVNDKALIDYAVPLIRIALMFACIGACQCVGGTIFRSTGYAKRAYFFSLLRMIIIFTPAIIILPKIFGNNGCWYAYAAADLISGIISVLYIKLFFKKILIKNK